MADIERKPSMGISSLMRALTEQNDALTHTNARLQETVAMFEARMQSFQDALNELHKRVEYIENG